MFTYTEGNKGLANLP